MVNLLSSFIILKSKTGSSRTARRLTFVHAATKVSKNAFAPCGGHLLCRISVLSTNNTAEEAGPLQGAFLSVCLIREKLKTKQPLQTFLSGEALKSFGF